MYAHRQAVRKVRISKKKKSQNPGLNQGPLDLQSNALPTELFRQIQLPFLIERESIRNTAMNV